MVLEVALGIVLAVIILAFLPVIVAAAGAVAVIALAAIIGLLGFRFISGIDFAGLNSSDLEALAYLIGIPVVLLVLVRLAERYTKVTATETVVLAFLLPALIHIGALLYGDLTGSPDGSLDHVGARLFGLAAAAAPVAWIAWRVRKRYLQ